MSCPICEKRKAARFCPAKGEKICAVCCGTERELTIDCPSDCSYLVAAHRYEDEHRRSLPADTPLLNEKIPQDIVYIHQQLMAALAFSIAKFCAVQPATPDLQNAELRHHLRKTARRAAAARTLRCIDRPYFRTQEAASRTRQLSRPQGFRTFPSAGFSLPHGFAAHQRPFPLAPLHRIPSRPIPAGPRTQARRTPYHRSLADFL